MLANTKFIDGKLYKLKEDEKLNDNSKKEEVH